MQVLQVVAKNTKVTCCIGDSDTPDNAAHILVSVPGWIKKKLEGRKKMDLKKLKMIIYDEADEIYLQEGNHLSIININKYLTDNKI